MDYVVAPYFLQELAKSRDLSRASLYISKSAMWMDAKLDSAVTNSVLLAQLNIRHKDKFTKVQEPGGGYSAFFWLSKNTVAVALPVAPKTQRSTLVRRHKEITERIQTANQAFFANHDPLTGLLNRNGMKLALDQHFRHLSEDVHEASSEQQDSPTDALAVFTCDIDHFKQINDTYGHDAGDTILAIFATRLKAAANALQEGYDGKLFLSRPGGEEFEIIATGSFSQSKLGEMASVILSKIRHPALPDNSEIQEINGAAFSREDFPSHVLASMGVASAQVPQEKQPLKELLDRVRRDADLALYRAKSDGRNCVRFFQDIRSRHGRVIEYHADSDLALIDIGTNVNVRNGDIFDVYFPPFTGEEDCVKDDGRSKKKIGSYIAVPSAEIHVLHPQEQISTCIVTARKTNEAIPAGALLRRRAVGSRPHLPHQRHYALPVGKRERLYERLESLINDGKLLAVLNLFPVDSTTDVEKRSRRLSEYVTLVHMLFPPATEVFTGNGANFYVTMQRTAELHDVAEEKRYVEAYIEQIDAHFPSRAGIYLSSLLPEGAQQTVDNVLHFARAALYVATNRHRTKTSFSYFSPNKVLLSWRDERNTEDAIVDYRAFKAIGLRDPRMENQLGLTILTSDDLSNFHLAELAFATACTQEPETKTFRANLGLLKVRLGKYQEAYDLLKGLEVATRGNYAIACAKAALEIKEREQVGKHEILRLIELATTQNLDGLKSSVYKKWISELEAHKQLIEAGSGDQDER